VKRPNILLLTTDQQRFDALGAAGNDEIHTPNLDALAAGGARFTRHFVQNPVCMPSRVSFLTGQYPSTLGITHMAVPVPAEAITLPRLLRHYGYTSANIGKLHFLPHANRDHRDIHPDYGFDHLEISDEPGCYEDAYRAWVRRQAPDQMDNLSAGLPPATEAWQRTMRIDDGIHHPPQRHENTPRVFAGPPHLTHTAFVADQTMEFIANHTGGPWMCVAGFYSPHAPWIAPGEFMDLYDPARLSVPAFPEEVDARRKPGHFDDEELRAVKRGYYAMVSEVDHHVGRILTRLEELGVADETIVVFWSDHGEWLGDHLRYGKGYPAHDCVARVPLILRYGGAAPAGTTVDGIVESVDVIPTLLDYCAIPIPCHLQGRSLRGLIEGTENEGRRSALTELTGIRILRTERNRYIAHADGREQLYDLEADFGEYHDLAGDPAFAATLAGARAELIRHMLEIQRPTPRAWCY